MPKQSQKMMTRMVGGTQRRGVILALMPFLIVIMLALAMLMVDLGYVFTIRSGMQNAGDSASLAAAMRLRFGDDNHLAAKALAIQFANLNQPNTTGSVLTTDDIVIGRYDFATRQFTPNEAGANAVQVTVRRNNTQSASLVLFFSKVFGLRLMEMDVASITAFDIDVSDTGEITRSFPYLVN